MNQLKPNFLPSLHTHSTLRGPLPVEEMLFGGLGGGSLMVPGGSVTCWPSLFLGA